MAIEGSSRKRWSEEETVLALYLYFQLPFGKLHSGNPEIQELAAALGRTNSSVAMKLCNFASLDPKITDSGRKGLDGASKLDRAAYAEFGQDWTGLVSRAEDLWAAQIGQFDPSPAPSRLNEKRSEFRFETYQGESTTQALVNQRVGQDFFRRAVLANYEETCCITGIAATIAEVHARLAAEPERRDRDAAVVLHGDVAHQRTCAPLHQQPARIVGEQEQHEAEEQAWANLVERAKAAGITPFRKQILC